MLATNCGKIFSQKIDCRKVKQICRQLKNRGQTRDNINFTIFNSRINCLPDVRGTCKSVPNLTRQQLELCYKANDVTLAAVEGLELAVKECEYQVSSIVHYLPTITMSID